MNTYEEKIESVVDAILDDYDSGRDIDREESRRTPDKNAIIDIIEKLRKIMFFGYFTDSAYQAYISKHSIPFSYEGAIFEVSLSMLIEEAIHNLTQQIALVYQNSDEPDAEAHAQDVCLEFFQKIPQVRAMVQTDLQASYDGDPAATSMAEIIFAYPGLFAITVYRLAHELYLLKVPMIPRIMTEYAHSITGIDIHPGATVGKFFFIDHGTGIVIGETTVIGDNVKIYQGVTLGALSTRGGQSLRGKRRHPTIEDNVTIYAGTSVLGGETVIGQGSVIGANAFITKSVAPCTTVTTKTQELQMKTREGCTDCRNLFQCDNEN